jgi:hypothetical protein
LIKEIDLQKSVLAAVSVLSRFKQKRIEDLARQTGFIRRKRKVSGLQFLLALLCGVVPCASPSLESMAACFEVCISRQALHKRFTESAVAFVKAILSDVFTDITTRIEPLKAGLAQFQRIILCDSTQWQLKEQLQRSFPGYGGGASKAACKLQTAVDLISGEILLADYHKSTRPDQGYGSTILKKVRSGDLLLFDLGYYSVLFFNSIISRGAFFICPIYYNVITKTDDHQASVAEFLLNSKVDSIDRLLQVGTLQSTSLRLVAFRNSTQKAANLRKKVREDYRKHGRVPPKQRLLFCDWTTLITNLEPNQLSAQNVIELYRCRWHIEIFFRDAKSHLRLDLSSSKNRYRFEAQLLAVLILAAILYFIHGRFNFHAQNQELSLDKFIKRFSQVAGLIRWHILTQKFDYLFPIFEKLLRNSIKFYQPSRLTPRQILQKAGALS